MACSRREAIQAAARNGIGALTFAFVDPAEARQWVDEYYRVFKAKCVPIGHTVNAERRHDHRLLGPSTTATRPFAGAPKASASSAMRWATTTSSAITSRG